MTQKKIEHKFPLLKEKIDLYRHAKKNANRMKYLFKVSKLKTDEVILNAHIDVENKCLGDVKEEIFNLLRTTKCNVSIFSYWLNRMERRNEVV